MAINVLVADDSGVVRTIVGKTLELAGFELESLHEAANGEEALAILLEKKVDLALIDLNMPVMDGAEMLRRLSESIDFASLPVILITSEGMTERIEELRTMGVRCHLRKPVTPELIRAAVEEALRPTRVLDPRAALERVVPDVILKFAHAFCEKAEKSAMEAPARGSVRASIRFWAHGEGKLEIVVPSLLCLDLARNVLGCPGEGASPPELGKDTLGELASMTCGHVLSATEGDASPRRLSCPEIDQVEAAAWSEILSSPETVAFRVEHYPVLARLTWVRTGD